MPEYDGAVLAEVVPELVMTELDEVVPEVVDELLLVEYDEVVRVVTELPEDHVLPERVVNSL